MTSAEFIYQLGFDAGAASRDDEVMQAHFDGEKEMALRIVEIWNLDDLASLKALNDYDAKALVDILRATARLEIKEK